MLGYTACFEEEALQTHRVLKDGHVSTNSGVQPTAEHGEQGRIIPATISSEGAETECVLMDESACCNCSNSSCTETLVVDRLKTSRKCSTKLSREFT